MSSETGKETGQGYEGKLRIEYANNRIVIEDDDGNVRIIIGKIDDE